MIDVDWCMQVQGNPLYEELPDELLALLYPEGAPQCGPPAHPQLPLLTPLLPAQACHLKMTGSWTIKPTRMSMAYR